MFEIFQNEPHWLVSAFVGASIGFLMPLLVKILSATPKLFNKHYYCRWWNHYYITKKNGSFVVVYERVKVSHGVKEALSVGAFDSESGKIISKGTLVFEKDFAIFSMKSMRHKEMAFIRFPLLFPDKTMTMVGVSLAQDYNGLASAGVNVFSTESLSEAEVSDAVNVYTESAHVPPFIRVLKEPKVNKALHMDSQQVARQ